ncbi:hypothetical protein ACI3PL_27825, partial [Lacticaseibacillus paracasei]
MIPDCPGLSRHPGKPVTFTDSRGRVHDLTETPTLTYKEAAADPRLLHLGFASDAAVGELVRSGRLYPVFKN